MVRTSIVAVKAGGLPSPGAFSRRIAPQAGLTVRAVSDGLAGNPGVTVRFR